MFKIFFSDFFEVSPESIYQHGAFNISLINDLPLFIDPFLIFNSGDSEIQELHSEIIKYVKFLRDKSLVTEDIDLGSLEAWFLFQEVKQTWFGFSVVGNKGSGLGRDFASKLHTNLRNLFYDFGQETITLSSHVEGLCLVENGVGKDSISDFTTTLIKGYLAEYTQDFAKKHIDERFKETVSVSKARFNYNTETWEPRLFELPIFREEYVLLTPRRILTRGQLWINKHDMIESCLGLREIPLAYSNERLRAQVNNYFKKELPWKPQGTKLTKAERREATKKTFQKFPELKDYYIRRKEKMGSQAQELSELKVSFSEELFVKQVEKFIQQFLISSDFYLGDNDSFLDTRARLLILKDAIEKNSGQWVFHFENTPLSQESDLKVIFKIIWLAEPLNSESFNKNEFLPEVKLAKNTFLKKRLEKISDNVGNDYLSSLLEIMNKGFNTEELKTFCFNLNVEYENLEGEVKSSKIRELITYFSRRNNLSFLIGEGKKIRPNISWDKLIEINNLLTAIVFFSKNEQKRANKLIRDFDLEQNPNIILIDGRLSNDS